MAKNETENYSYMTRRIGSTTYRVKVFFDENSTESMEDKILRIVQNDLLEKKEKYDTMNVPQMSRQSERSAS